MYKTLKQVQDAFPCFNLGMSIGDGNIITSAKFDKEKQIIYLYSNKLPTKEATETITCIYSIKIINEMEGRLLNIHTSIQPKKD